MRPDKISNTAAFLAIKFYGLSRDKEFRHLFDESIIEFYDRLVKNLPAPLQYYHYWLTFKEIRTLFIKLEELLLPGDLLHVIARKYFIQQNVQHLIDKGYEQIIILGSGFDHLGWYYSQKGIYCLECDVPEMARKKKELLKKIEPGEKKPDIEEIFLPNDRLDDLFQKIPRLQADKKTIVVAEGFFDYLHADTVRNIFEQLTNYFSEQPAVTGTHFALDELPLFYRKVYEYSISLSGENLVLKNSKTEFRTLLSQIGFNSPKFKKGNDMQQEISEKTDSPLQIMKGFYTFYID